MSDTPPDKELHDDRRLPVGVDIETPLGHLRMILDRHVPPGGGDVKIPADPSEWCKRSRCLSPR